MKGQPKGVDGSGEMLNLELQAIYDGSSVVEESAADEAEVTSWTRSARWAKWIEGRLSSSSQENTGLIYRGQVQIHCLHLLLLLTNRVTTALFFSSQLQVMVREMRRAGRMLPTVRSIGTGGSVVLATVAEAAYEAFGGLETLLNIYGMTESCGVVTTQPKPVGCRSSTDVGIPVTGVTVKVVDVSTRHKLGPHQIGEICFRTPSMVRGYYNRPRESAELFDEEGWCKSGDAGYYDEDGRLYFCERLKQMIKCMDNQVVPSELEELLLRVHPAQIAEVCVVGLSHSEHGEAPAAAVVLTEEGKNQDLSTLVSDIKATVATNLAVHKHLYGGVYIVDSLPKTETAKVNRPALARSLACAVIEMAAKS
ncbi:hypothetical protein MTO96_033373 [Rhipicephalus appendiculatus]